MPRRSGQEELHAADGPVDDQGFDLHAPREQFVVATPGRNDAYRRRPCKPAGVVGRKSRHRRRGATALVHGEKPQVGEPLTLNLDDAVQLTGLQVDGLDQEPARSRRFDLESARKDTCAMPVSVLVGDF